MPSTMLMQILLARLFELCIYAEYGAYQDELPNANCTIVKRNIRRGLQQKIIVSRPMGIRISDHVASQFRSSHIKPHGGLGFQNLRVVGFTGLGR
jgi:hypothetical protein